MRKSAVGPAGLVSEATGFRGPQATLQSSDDSATPKMAPVRQLPERSGYRELTAKASIQAS